MGAESARKYNRNQALRVVNSVQTILDRINKRYTPLWMITELEKIQHNSQCILHEFEQIMREYGDEI